MFKISLDLNFWKYKEGVTHNNHKIYELACCNGETVEDLEILPIDIILKEVENTFSNWVALDSNHYENNCGGAFEIFTTSQIVRFDCYCMQDTDMNSLMDILIDFGCPLYDPNIATRFDSWTDR